MSVCVNEISVKCACAVFNFSSEFVGCFPWRRCIFGSQTLEQVCELKLKLLQMGFHSRSTVYDTPILLNCRKEAALRQREVMWW